MSKLFLITARGGSKGILNKNIKNFNGKALIHYSIQLAREFASDDCICVSTDSQDIIAVVEKTGLTVPFLRPAELASDTAASIDVIKHALNYYKEKKVSFEALVLLQPTSPLRMKKHLSEALALFNNGIDAVVSVKQSKSNPYNNLFETNDKGFLKKIIEGQNYTRRQDVPPLYEINGAIYIFNTAKLYKNIHAELGNQIPYIMPAENSLDIDTMLDWTWGEYLLEKNIVNLDYE